MGTVYGEYTNAINFASITDDETHEQIVEICSNPLFRDCKIRIMPDCHKGFVCMVGFTSDMPKGGELIPSIIGADQYCGMYVVKLKKAKTLNDYPKLDKVIREYVPSGDKARNIISPFVPEELKERVHKITTNFLKEGDRDYLHKIGTLGGGNHFISIEKGSTGTYLIIHSGSRNLGHKLAVYFQKLAVEKNFYGKENISKTSYLIGEDREDYLYCADVCRDYAHWNRKVMAEEILRNMGWKAEEVFETLHNYIGDDGIIRKGAISAKKDEKVIIPLNMADGSLICIGKGNEDWNNSAPHGAGRLWSRQRAVETLTMKEYKERMKGVYSTCICAETLNESPMAYKNADITISSIKDTVDIIDHLKPLYNFKAK